MFSTSQKRTLALLRPWGHAWALEITHFLQTTISKYTYQPTEKLENLANLEHTITKRIGIKSIQQDRCDHTFN
jgi:galactose-1-phosphate uridylyltransferase